MNKLKKQTNKEEPYSKCQICGKPRIVNGEEEWTTRLEVVDIRTELRGVSLCICHDCRSKYSLRKIFDNRIRGLMRNEE
jgi:hypothetical protein